MTVSQRHITAGDLTPVTIKTESTYGTPTGDPVLYGDVAEGGKFTFTDNPNPHMAWRYGSRSFDPADYVTQQKDAGFNATLEVRDVAGWQRIIAYATGNGGTNNGILPSRTESIHIRTASAQWQGRQYTGCKTDRLTIKAEAPGDIVTFEEVVLASKGEPVSIGAAISAWASSAPAVQWMNGITLNGREIYPQSFELGISNNLDRVRINKDGEAITGALPAGRREITFQADIWMEDLAPINADIANGTPGNIVLTLGISNPVTLTLTGVRWMADGTHPDLVQDKQRQTLRFRATDIAITTPVLMMTPPEE